ncbi:MAG: hypothetical protein JXA06_06900 [Bacteroidetes bacterium]|nr:hypothetical protein [Bacteroidota bacterium]
MSNFAKYLAGIVFIALGLSWAAYMFGTSPFFISIGATTFIGIGIPVAVSKIRHKERCKAEKYVSYWRKVS